MDDVADDDVLRHPGGVAQAGVHEEVHPAADHDACESQPVVARHFHAHDVSVYPQVEGRDFGIGCNDVVFHALVDGTSRFADVFALGADVGIDACQVGKAAVDVRAQNALVGDLQAVEHVFHVVPALNGHERALLGESACLFLGFLAVAVERTVEVADAVGLAERLDQERVVGPTGAGDGLEVDVSIQQVVPAVDGRPNGGVVLDDLHTVAKREQAMLGHACAIAAVDLQLLGRVGVDHAPVGGFHDVGFGIELVGVVEHGGVHAGLDPVIGFDDGDPVSGGFVDTAVARGAIAFVGLVDDADAPVAFGELLHDG